MSVLRVQIRSILASWRSAHPLLWISLFACLAMLWYAVGHEASWYDRFFHDRGSALGPLALITGIGFLVTALHDRTEEDPWLPYMTTRPVRRAAILVRSAAIPLIFATLWFLVLPSIRMELEHDVEWRKAMGRRSSWVSSIGLDRSELNRQHWTGASQADDFRRSGHRVFHFYLEMRVQNPERFERDRREDRARTARLQDAVRRLKSERESDQRADAAYRDYLRWRDQRGPMTDALRDYSWSHSWVVITAINDEWIVLVTCFAAFCAGVWLRCLIVFGTPSGVNSGVRYLLSPRTLIPICVVAALLNERLRPRSIRHRRWWEDPQLSPVVEWSLLHPGLAALTLAIVATLAALLLTLDWKRRDIT